MFKDYLVVSGAILWERRSALRERWGRGAVEAASLVAATLLTTVSSAWLGADVLLTAIGLLTMRQRDRPFTSQWKRPGPVIFVVTGIILFTMNSGGAPPSDAQMTSRRFRSRGVESDPPSGPRLWKHSRRHPSGG